MEYAISAVWLCIESMALFFACKAFLKQKIGLKQTVAAFVCALCVSFILNNLTGDFFQNNLYIKMLLSFIIAFLAVSLTFSGAWYVRIILVATWLFIIGIAETIMLSGVSFILGLSVSELVWKKWLYTIVGTASKCVVLFGAWSLSYFRNKKEPIILSNKRLLLTMLFPIISLAMLCVIFNTYKDQSDLSVSAIVFSIILGLSNVLIIYLMTSLDRASRAEQQIAMLNQSMQLQTNSYLALEKSYKAQRSATHEFKHQLQTVHGLLEQNNVEKAKEYIQQIQAAHTLRIFAANTGHAVIDAILNEKYHTAREKNIDFQLTVNDLSTIVISIDSIVVLLSNLLDNAIEACERLDGERTIICTVLLEDNALFISIKNTSPPVRIVDGQIETVKEPKAEHGFGLAGVQRVLALQNGESAMEYLNGWFNFAAEIPNQ